MLYIIDNERSYEAHKLLLVESDLELSYLKSLLVELGPYDSTSPTPSVIATANLVNWEDKSQCLAAFDCEVWHLLFGDPPDAFSGKDEIRRYNLMQTVLRAESTIWVRHFARPGYGRPANATYCKLDETVPARAAVELRRRKIK